MQLKVVELELRWPKSLSILELRPWLLNQLRSYGEPLRWAITSIHYRQHDNLTRDLTVEAVVIVL